MAVLGPGGRSFNGILEAAQWYTEYFFPAWITNANGYIIPRCFKSAYEFPRAPASGYDESQEDIEVHMRGEDAELCVYKLIENQTKQMPVLAFHSLKYNQPQQNLLNILCPGLHVVYKDNLKKLSKIKGENVEEDYILFCPSFGIAVVEVKAARNLNAAKKHMDHASQETIPKLEALIAAIHNYFAPSCQLPLIKVIVFPNLSKSEESERRLRRQGYEVLTEESMTTDHWLSFWQRKKQFNFELKDVMPFLCVVLALTVGEAIDSNQGRLLGSHLPRALAEVGQKINKQTFLNSKYSRWFEQHSCAFLLTPEQHSIWNHSVSKLLLRGIAGTGKTLLIQAKVLSLLVTAESEINIVVIVPSTLMENYEWTFQKVEDSVKKRLHLKTFDDFVADANLRGIVEEEPSHVFIDEAPMFYDNCRQHHISVNFYAEDGLYRWLAEDAFQVRIQGGFNTVDDVVEGFTIAKLSTVLRCTPDIAAYWEVEYGRDQVLCGCNVQGPQVTEFNYDLDLAAEVINEISFEKYACDHTLSMLNELLNFDDKAPIVTKKDIAILCNDKAMLQVIHECLARNCLETCSISTQLHNKDIAIGSFTETLSQEWLAVIVIHLTGSAAREVVANSESESLIALANRVADLQERSSDKNFYLAYSRTRSSLTVIKKLSDRLCSRRNIYIRKLITLVTVQIEQTIESRLVKNEGYPNFYPFMYLKFQKLKPNDLAYAAAVELYRTYVMATFAKVRSLLPKISLQYLLALETLLLNDCEGHEQDILQYIISKGPSAEEIWFLLPLIAQECFQQFFPPDGSIRTALEVLEAAAALHYDDYIEQLSDMFEQDFSTDYKEEEGDIEQSFTYENMADKLYPADSNRKTKFLESIATQRISNQEAKINVIKQVRKLQGNFQDVNTRKNSSPSSLWDIITDAIGEVAKTSFAEIAKENELCLKLFDEEKFTNVFEQELEDQELFAAMSDELRDYAAMQLTADAIIYLIYSAGFMIELVPY